MERDNNLYLWAAGLLIAVALGLLGISATVVSAQTNPSDWWNSPIAYLAYGCFMVAIICVVGAIRDWRFPWVGRNSDTSALGEGTEGAALGDASPTLDEVLRSPLPTQAQIVNRDLLEHLEKGQNIKHNTRFLPPSQPGTLGVNHNAPVVRWIFLLYAMIEKGVPEALPRFDIDGEVAVLRAASGNQPAEANTEVMAAMDRNLKELRKLLEERGAL